jgi:diacylglycerol kinase
MNPRPRIPLWTSFAVAGRGFWDAVRGERSFRIHLAVAALVIPLGAWLQLPRGDWLAMLICIGMMLTTELLNTAIEAVVDLASPERHELARKSKDVAAGAVLTVSCMSASVGIIILVIPLYQRLFG